MIAVLRRLLDSLVGGRLAYLALFVVVHVVLAFTTSGITLLDVVELALIIVPYSVLIVRWHLTRPHSIVLTVCLLLTATIGIWTLPTDGRPAGYNAWYMGAILFVLLGFALAGQYVEAWLVLLGIAVVAVSWSVLTGQGPMPGVLLVVRHFATLLVGTLFAISYRRSNAAFAAYKAAERRDRAAEQAATARAGARRGAAEAVLEQAGPMLRAIAEGRRLSAADRRELLVLEGSLRDQIRVPGLVQGRLRDSIAAARRRGVNVLLLDDTHTAADADGWARAAEWLADQVDAVHGDRFVGRVRATEDGIKVTAVADDHNESATFRGSGVLLAR